VENAAEVVERITDAGVTPVDDAGDATTICIDVPGVEVAVQEAAGLRV
jgi:hypothetical protein